MDPEERRHRRVAADRRRRKRRYFVAFAIGGLLILAIVGAGLATNWLRSEDPTVAEGIAVGESFSNSDSLSSAEEENERLRRQLERERRKAERDDRKRSASSGSSKGFAALQDRVGGSTGVSFGPVGGGSATSLGDWSSGVAWSTIKVPIAIAVLRQNGGTVTDSMRSAIQVSDNSGAEAMWAALGSGTTASNKVEKVLRSAGDSSTVVQSEKVRAEFTPFGQTEWSLEAQQQFASQLPCISKSDSVLELMGTVSSDQSWGLGSIGTSQKFKGGWGPGIGGGYLVRQFGIIQLSSGGRIAVAIAHEPSDGQFSTGTQNMTEIANWVEANAEGSKESC